MPAPAQTIRFDDFAFDADTLRLSRAGEAIALERRPALLLRLLAGKQGQVVERDEIADALWGPGLHIEVELGVNTAMRKLRRALGDDPQSPRFIETVKNRGYRFAAPVQLPRARHRIAVMPFEDLGADRDIAATAAGLTEDTTAHLARVAPDRITVLGRASSISARAAGLPPAEIAKRLGADFLVEASLRAEKSRIRVVASLVEARTDARIWSESYEGEPTRLLDFQEQVSRAIATRIGLHLAGGRVELARRQTANPDAFALYAQGRRHWQAHSRAGNEAAVALYREALTLDPGYALAWAGLAETLALAPVTADTSPLLVRDEAAAAGDNAIGAGPDLAETWTSRGFVRFWLERNWSGAEQDFRRAIALDPGFAFAQRMLAVVLSHQGVHEEAEDAIRLACALDPLFAMHHALASQVAFQARDAMRAAEHARHATIVAPSFWIGHHMLAQAEERCGAPDRALASAERALALTGGHSKTTGLKGYVLARTGRPDAARALLEAVDAAAAQRFVPPTASALILLGLGAHDAALAALERALSVGDVNLAFLTQDPKYDELRTSPRFAAILARAGIAPAPDLDLHLAFSRTSAARHTGRS